MGVRKLTELKQAGNEMTTSSVPIDVDLLPERRKKDSARVAWDTKPKRAPNPKDIEFQTAEIVIPNPNRDQQKLSTFIADISRVEIDRTKMNRLIWGDNMLAMQALLASGYEGKIALIYIDPPFSTNENYYLNVAIDGEEVTKSPSVIERLAYKDYWEGGVDSYLDMLYPRLHLMKKLLAKDGSICVHTDWHMGHYVKVLMDEVFGSENLVNEIIWKRVTAHSDPGRCGAVHDTILWFKKSEKFIFNPQYVSYDKDYLASHYSNVDEKGRKYMLDNLNPPHRRGPVYEFHGLTRPWRFTQEKMLELDRRQRIYKPPGKTPRLIRYLDEMPGVPLQDLWTDINPVNSQAKESTGFETQKPVELMERIIKMCSGEGDLVADFFTGSGTTLVAAESLERRWIGSDFSKTSIQITRNRLVTGDSKPFLIENIGNYQRHMIYLSGGRIFEMQHIVLKLYGAMPRKDFPELGTKKGDDGLAELVYVGYPDRAVTAKKTEELAHLAENLDGSGYRRLVILGWDYEYNYEELLAPIIAPILRRTKIDVQKRTIPPEVYEYLKTHSSADDIDSFAGKVVFHEKPFLELTKPRRERSKGFAKVDVGIERYIVYDLPIENEKQKDEVQEIVRKNFSALLDYWAVDWEYDGTTFKSSWQAFRGFGREIKQVPLSATHTLPTGKKYTIAVRAVDIFGNDATGTCTVDLR